MTHCYYSGKNQRISKGTRTSSASYSRGMGSGYGANSPMLSMVWSGGVEWLKCKSSIIALASAIPTNLANFLPWSSTVPSDVTPSQVSQVTGKVILSIGGSSGGDTGFSAMATDGVDAWVTYFQNMFKTSGLQGLDWDLEGISQTNNVVWDFVGQLSTKLKAAGSLITFTIVGNKDNSGFPALSFLNTYLDSCDYVAFMFYNGGMWVDSVPLNEFSWCTYLDSVLQLVPAMKSKCLIGLYPKGGANSCCAPCIQKAVDLVRSGTGAGIALWCQGGYTGSCSQGSSIVAAWVDVLNSGGGTSVQDFQVHFSDCSGPTSYNGCGYKYACISNSCLQQQTGSYNTNDCSGACASPSGQMYSCNSDTGLCQVDSGGTYNLKSTCDASCKSSNPTVMYSCNSDTGLCQVDSGGTYNLKSTCDASCTSSNPTVMYSCNSDTGLCQVDSGGTYNLKSTCDASCTSSNPVVSGFSCNNGTCQPDTNVTYSNMPACEAACPKQFNCFSGNCMPGYPGKYSSLTDCQNSCVTQNYYSCSGASCQVDPNGTFVSSNCDNACQVSACSTLGYSAAGSSCSNAGSQFTCNGETRCCTAGTPSPNSTNPTACLQSTKLYNCVSGVCTESTNGTGTLYAACQSSCVPPKLYNCVSGVCTESTEGTGKLYADCSASCSITYTCQNGVCKPSPSGTTGQSYTDCVANCTTPNNNLYKCTAQRTFINKKEKCVVM
jgi:hypothetical protein